MVLCTNCHIDIDESKIILHQRFCFQNIKYCDKCKEGFPIEEFDESIYKNIVEDVTIVASTIYENSVTSREKDYTDYFRTMVYRNEKEMNAVVGALQENEFLLQLKEDTRQFILDIERVFQGIIH